jgi:hypothetical protein
MDDNQFKEMNMDGELFNNVTYTSDRNGSRFLVSVGIETEYRAGAKYLVLEDLFMQGADGLSRVLAPGNLPEAQKGTGVFRKVLADMTRYATSRGYAGIGCSKVVNPILLLALLRKGFTTGDPSTDRSLLADLQSYNFTLTPSFYNQHEVLRGRTPQWSVYRKL